MSLSEVDLSSLDTSLWSQELHSERYQIPLVRQFSVGMVPEMPVSRFPVIAVGEEF